MSLAELSENVGLPRATAYRIETMLSKQGFVEKNHLVRTYTIGARLADLAFDAIGNVPSRMHRRRLLANLSEAIGETVSLGVLASDEVVYLERVECTRTLRAAVTPGATTPLHGTAIGKLLLAYARSRVPTRLSDPEQLLLFTANTIKDPSVLWHELSVIRKRGWASDNEEFTVGVHCLAVPVKDRRGKVIAGLVVSGPVSRFPLHESRKHLPELLTCAEKVGEELGSLVSTNPFRVPANGPETHRRTVSRPKRSFSASDRNVRRRHHPAEKQDK